MGIQYLLLIAALSFLPTLYTQPDTSVCIETKSNNSGPPLPSLSEVFSVRVEVNVVQKNLTIDVHEWHDGPGDVGAATVWYTGLPFSFVYSYATDELFSVEHLAGGKYSCQVKELNTGEEPYLHGTRNSTDRHIYSTARAFGFGGNLEEHYQGRSTARGIATDVWRACVNWPDMAATMVVEWHFTARDSWDTAVGLPQVPVRCHVQGTAADSGGGRHSFEHLYEVTEFRPYLDRGVEVFETPAGTVCAGRKNTKPLPVTVDAFSFESEVLNVEQQYTQYIKKAFDRNLKLATIEFVSATKPQATIRLIDDFNTGVSYSLDLVHGNCSVTAIDPVGFDAMKTESGLRMRTSKEFFFFNVAANYSYEGTRNVRQLNADVWVAKQQSWPPNNPTNSTWEYYFITPEWTDNGQLANKNGLPLAVHVSLEGQTAHQVYNIYNFREGDPHIWTYDIAPCFPSSHQRRRLRLSFPVTEDQRLTIVSNQNAFRRAFLTSVTSLVRVSPVRLNDIHMEYVTGSVDVDVVLVESALPSQPVLADPMPEDDLDTAYAGLQAAISGGTFTLTLQTPSSSMRLVARPYTSQSSTSAPTRNLVSSTSTPPRPTPPLLPRPAVQPSSPQPSGRQTPSSGPHVLLCPAHSKGYTAGDIAGVSMGTAFASFILVFAGLLTRARCGGLGVLYHRDRMELS